LTTQHKEQKSRSKAARDLLKQANCGEIIVEGRTVKVKIAPCGMLYGMGRDKSMRINPLDVVPPSVAEVVNM
jgi:hypothetical protein